MVGLEFCTYMKITDAFRFVRVSFLLSPSGRVTAADTKCIQSKSGINDDLVM
jgi:hypothetical protein